MHGLLVVALGLAELTRPTSGLPTDHGFVYGTLDGELSSAGGGAAAPFRLRIHDRAVHAWAQQGPTLIASDDLGGVLLFDLETRALRAKIPASAPGSGELPPVLTDGQVYLESSNGQWAAHSTERGQLLFRVEALGLAGDGAARLYAARARELAALAPRTGKPMWRHPLSGAPRGSPAVDADGVVLVTAEPNPRKRGAVTHAVQEWTHEAGAEPRWRSVLSGTPRTSPVACGPGVGVLLEPAAAGGPASLARFDRLDGRSIGTVEVADTARLACAGDLFVITQPAAAGHLRVLVAAPTGELLWERSDHAGFVGRDGGSVLLADEAGKLSLVSAESGASRIKHRMEFAVEQSPRPEGQALLRFVQDGEELQLGTRDTSSVRLRVYRGGVLEPSLTVSAAQAASLPSGLRLSRDGLIFGRARGRGLYAVPLEVGTPGRAPLSLALALRLGPRTAPGAP